MSGVLGRVSNTSQRRVRPIPIGWKSGVMLVIASLAGLGMFCWPLVIPAEPSSVQHVGDAPFAFILILPILVFIVLAQLSEGGMDAKALAILGVMSAINAALRPLGAGTNGIETVFFLLILCGRVFGPGFGFVLGCTSIFASALLTAGVGPWLPFQMMCSAWVGMGAGLLPDRLFGKPIRGKAEIAMLVGYGIIAAYFFGTIMNLWFWPFITSATMGDNAGLAYVAGAPVFENLHRFLIYTFLTSTVIWDTGRAITNAIAIVIVGPSVVGILRRAVRKANFAPLVEFVDEEFQPGRQPQVRLA